MFSQMLQQVIDRVDGAKAIAIVGADGMLVEQAGGGLCAEMDLLAAEYASILRGSASAARDTGLGSLRELMVATDELTLLIRILSHEYFLLLAVLPSGNVGRARFELRKAHLVLEHEFVM